MNVWSPTPVIAGYTRQSRARERILAVTRAMLAQSSFDSLSLEAVATAAGVTRRTVYNQFADKAELYRVSRLALLHDLAADIDADVPPRLSPADGIRYFAEAAHDIFADPRNIELVRSLIRDAHSQAWLATDYERLIRRPLRRACEAHVLRHLSRARAEAEARAIADGLVSVLDALSAGPQLLANAALPAGTRERAAVAAAYARRLDS